MSAQRRLRILHTEASVGWGGQELRILSEASGMIERGHDITLVCPAEANILEAANKRGIPAHALDIGRKNARGVIAIRRWLKQNPVDIVNTHSSTDSWLTAIANLSLPHKVPIVRTRHVSTSVNRSRSTFWLYQRATSHIVVTGEALKQQLIRDNGFAADTMTSVPTGIDLEQFHWRDPTTARQSLPWPEGVGAGPVIGILATLRDWKGHTVLFDALAQILPQRPTMAVVVVGDGPYRDRIDLKLQALGPQVSERVFFVGHREDPHLWLNAFDMFVLPSWGDEGVSQAVMQAMASRLPIIATPVGAMTEIVIHDQTGLIVPPRDPQALAAAIDALLDQPERAQRLAHHAAQFAAQHCSRGLMLDRMESIFQRYAVKGH